MRDVCHATKRVVATLLRPAGVPASTTDFKPVERELVFDIDLTDYDDVRTCGKGGHICSSCWPLMGLAIEVGASRHKGAKCIASSHH